MYREKKTRSDENAKRKKQTETNTLASNLQRFTAPQYNQRLEKEANVLKLLTSFVKVTKLFITNARNFLFFILR